MTDTIRVGESGKRHRINTQFDMSSNTSLGLVYTNPVDGTLLSVTATLGTTTQTIDGVSVAANFWLFYDFSAGELPDPGKWDVQVTYTNTAPTPDDIFKNLDPITLIVGD